MDPYYYVIGAGALVAGGVLGSLVMHLKARGKDDAARQQLEADQETSRKELERRRERLDLEFKAKTLEARKEIDKELSRRRADVDRLERKLQSRESNLDHKIDSLDKREHSLKDAEKDLDRRRQQLTDKEHGLDREYEVLRQRCEEVSGMTSEQARELLLQALEKEVRHDAAALVKRIESETKEIAAKKARQILTLAIEKYANETVTESTVSVVQLPGDDMKGRIIGREGRNIRALEAATGVNIIVDDTPEAIVLSCFDPYRREIARQTLEKLIGDGRIHPGRIEEVAERLGKEMEEKSFELGERVCFDLGIHDIHPEIIKLLGRLKYRTSYGQNVLQHSQEVAYLTGMMASELGIDPRLAKRAGLLHDIGKALSHESEGPHALVGAELARKYKEKPAVTHAMAAHHNEEEPKTLIAMLVKAADALSAARPGARRETLESYVKRLNELEGIANSFDGVERSFAIQAGREVRIAVDPGKLGDKECSMLARDVAKRIEGEMQYPGQIKITVLRELRVSEFAK